jgi:hypothetical protein
MQRFDARERVWSILTIATIVGAIVINAISNVYPINGLNVGAISNTVFAGVVITPANYAFAIWGVIYLGIIAFGIYQLSPSRNRVLVQKLRIPLISASLFQSLWVFQFLLRNFWLSVVLMIGILISLAIAFLEIYQPTHRLSRLDKWLIQIPFSVYFGWISVATIVNIATALYSNKWDGSGISPTVWTIILSVIAATIAGIITIRYRDVAFTAVIVWALVAIAVRQASQLAISSTTVALAIGLIMLALFTKTQFGRRSQ